MLWSCLPHDPYHKIDKTMTQSTKTLDSLITSQEYIIWSQTTLSYQLDICAPLWGRSLTHTEGTKSAVFTPIEGIYQQEVTSESST